MAWFRHHFCCETCDGHWLVHGAGPREDDCPFCGARDLFPYRSDDRTRIIEAEADGFVVLGSAETAKDDPDDRELGRFRTRADAEAFLVRAP